MLRAGCSTSSIKSAQAYRYIALRSFFTKQAIDANPRHPIKTLKFRSVSPLVQSSRISNQPRRWNSSPTRPPCPNCDSAPVPLLPKVKPPDHAQDYIPFIRRIIRNSGGISANSSTRPTKEQLLNGAGSHWERLRIRLKWFTIRGWRRFNTDDLSAFASWFVVGNTLWILIGTTTFVSAVLYTLNYLSLQDYVARWISDYLTYETGMTVIFESAIVPKWGASTITFSNVYISRRPQSQSNTDAEETAKRIRASKATPPVPIPFLSSSLSADDYLPVSPAAEGENYTMFDVNLDEVEVTLSFMRWLDGKGLVKDAKVKGVRGVIDRRSVFWDKSNPLAPADFRHKTRPGDFELESMQVEDALLTIYQPGGQRPYNVSVFNASIGPLRKRWMFYDMMSSEAITGQLDNCLFSLHMPQKLGSRIQGEEGDIKRLARFRIDGLPIEHAQYATGHTGPMSWITSGKVDAVLDIKFPHHPDDQVDIKAILDEIGRNVVTISHGEYPDASAAATAAAAAEASTPRGVIPGQSRLARPPLRAPSHSIPSGEREVTVDIDLRFRDLKAAVPIYTTDLSVRNNALIRPIVAFINANRTLVPIHCRVASDLSNFDGSWTLFETGLMTTISEQMYDALAHHVSSEVANSRRIRQVSFWGIQRGAELLLDTTRSVVDPVHAQLMAPF